MAYPIAAGARHIGSDTMRYIPVIYSAKVMANYRDVTVLTKVTNTDYEGEIKKYGDTVYVRKDPTLTIRDYRKGQNLVNEQPEATSTSLLIDKGKYWSFLSFDLDDVQTDIKGYIGRWASDGAYGMSRAIDVEVLAAMASGADSYNKGSTAGKVTSSYNMGVDGTPRVVTRTDVLDFFVDAGSVLDEQNVPDTDRFMVINPRVEGLIKKSDIKDVSMTGDSTSAIRNGLIGMINRFTVYRSNLLPFGTVSTTSVYCPFGIKDATTFATQMVASKIQDNPFGFGQLHRALNIYGYKVIRPEALGVGLLSVS